MEPSVERFRSPAGDHVVGSIFKGKPYKKKQEEVEVDVDFSYDARAAGKVLAPSMVLASYTPLRSVLYEASINSSAASNFWMRAGMTLDWFVPYTSANTSAQWPDIKIKWFEDGELNLSYNCLDRHVNAGHGSRVAIHHIDADVGVRSVTYKELLSIVCKTANVLKYQGVQRGDRVIIYMGMLPETYIVMLACLRIGAVHAVVFSAFSPEALASRINDCGAKVVVTTDVLRRGLKRHLLHESVMKAIDHMGTTSPVEVVLVHQVGGNVTYPTEDLRMSLNDLVLNTRSSWCPPESLKAEDVSFILYTSGTTGNPKGIFHSTGGYGVYAAMTYELGFDAKPDSDVYWSTSDVGWITGHTYGLYGPMLAGSTSIMAPQPFWPDCGTMFDIIKDFQVTTFYTAPTLIRMVQSSIHNHRTLEQIAESVKTLRILGSVGEPIGPDNWKWFRDVIGRGVCPVIDTWWQTEGGGFMICPKPYVDREQKPGCATGPFFGIQPGLVDCDGYIIDGQGNGALVIHGSWPGMARGIWGDHQRFVDAYFSHVPGCYFTGDQAKRDELGHYWITGRVDDQLNVSGHLLSTAEIEGVLNELSFCKESAVVGFPHRVKGEALYLFISLNFEKGASETKTEVNTWIRRRIGNHATVDMCLVVNDIPKTRSGKIMRRVLRNVARGNLDDIGDLSAMADRSSITDILSLVK